MYLVFTLSEKASLLYGMDTCRWTLILQTGPATGIRCHVTERVALDLWTEAFASAFVW